jgi:hypothetical protein
MFVCCVISGRGLCDELITGAEEPTDCGASLCVIKKSRARGEHSPRCAAQLDDDEDNDNINKFKNLYMFPKQKITVPLVFFGYWMLVC